VYDGPTPQPVKQVAGVRGVEELGEGVTPAGRALAAVGDRQQVHVVIAEHRDRLVSESAYQPQGIERARPAVDEVAGEPKAVIGRVEIDPVEQAFEVGMAALNVADGEYGHEFSRLDSRFS
jgi:hypothetical protein